LRKKKGKGSANLYRKKKKKRERFIRGETALSRYVCIVEKRRRPSESTLWEKPGAKIFVSED